MNTHTDPSGLFGTAGTLVAAVIALLVAFGVPLTPDQTQAILGVLAAAGPAVVAWRIRRHAYAPETVDDVRTAAYRSGYHEGLDET